MPEKNNEPEFNNGFVTALVLFYRHRYTPRFNYTSHSPYRISRLYGAADHLFDIQYPSDKWRKRVSWFVDMVLRERLTPLSPSMENLLFDTSLRYIKCINSTLPDSYPIHLLINSNTIPLHIDKTFGLDPVVNYW